MSAFLITAAVSCFLIAGFMANSTKQITNSGSVELALFLAAVGMGGWALYLLRSPQ